MKTRCAVLFMLLLMSFLSTAAPVMLAGGPSCGQWINERDATGKKPGEWNSAWLLGYLSGLAAGMGKDILKEIESLSIYLWMDNYCRANPLPGY
jgi:hypothetical protein